MFKRFKKAQDPISSYTHFIGAIASCLAMVLMLGLGFVKGLPLDILVSITIFGISSICLYSASWIYHYYNQPEEHRTKKLLRKLDHSMIYVLIAGTYTPITIAFVEAPHSYYFLAVIWIIAILGIVMKIFWLQAPRMLSTIFYLLMGWAIVFDFSAFHAVPLGCFVLIAIGGVMYSIGAVIYIAKKPNWFKPFDFHDVFHIFVMLGSFFHFLSVFIYIL